MKCSSILRQTMRITVALAAIMCIGISIAIYNKTLIPVWHIAIIALLLTFTTIPFSSKWIILTENTNRYINYICHLLIISPLIACAFLFSNYYYADTSSIHDENAMIRSKYTKEHMQYRKIGRKHYIATNHPYTTYHIEIEFDNGETKKYAIATRKEYNNMQTGTMKKFRMANGLWGYPVIISPANVYGNLSDETE